MAARILRLLLLNQVCNTTHCVGRGRQGLTLKLLRQTICGHLSLNTLEPAGSCQTYLAPHTHCTSVKPSAYACLFA